MPDDARAWQAVIDACTAVPDITLSKWACTPGHHWEPVRAALKALRKGQGFDVDANIDGFDGQGQLRSRRSFQYFLAKHSLADVDDDIADESDGIAQHAPSPDYRIYEEDDS